MSSSSELTISGIRAFDNHDSQTMQFNTPLTLICGANGVGKTTIIECLRYVTTGDLPPNAKGGAFVHDPKMSSKSSVKAQIRSKFRDFKGRPMQAARSMQLTVSKKNVYSSKSLDGYLTADSDRSGVPAAQLRRNRTGDPAMDVKSARNADLNVLVPQSLGIPPAISNYVMFCHQEESQWPLAEASQVKKRFDQIFEATRYTKALDSLKTMRKDYALTTKLDEAEVNHLKQDEERVAEKWKQVRHYEQQQHELSQECAAIRARHAKLVNEHGKALEHRQWMQQSQYVENDAQTQSDRTLQDIEMSKSDISEPELAELSESDLQKQSETVDAYDSELASEIQHKRRDHSRIMQQIEDLGSTLAGLMNQQGRVQEMIKANEQRKSIRRDLVTAENEALTEWNEDWTRSKKEEIEVSKTQFEQVEISNRQAEEKLASKLNGLEAQKLQLRQQASTLKSSSQKCNAKINELQTHLRNARSATSNTESEFALEGRIHELEKRFTEAEARKAEFEKENSVAKAARNVKEAEIVSDDYRKLVQLAINASDSMNRLNYLRDSEKESRTKIEALTTELQGAAKIAGINVTIMEQNNDDTLKTEINSALNSRKEEVDIIASKLAKSRSDFEFNKTMTAQAESKLNGLKSERNKILRNLAPSHQKLGDGDNTFQGYETLVDSAEKELMEATEQEEQLQFAHSFFTRALSLAENPESPVCLLCEHHKTPKEASTLVKKLKNKIMALSITPEEAQQMTEEARNTVSELRSYQPLVENVRRLNSEIDTMNKDMADKFETQSTSSQSQVDALFTEHQHATQSLQFASDSLEPLLIKLSRFNEELQTTRSKIELEQSLIVNEKDQISSHEAQKRQQEADSISKSARQSSEAANETEKRIQQEVYHYSNGIKELKLKSHEVCQKTTAIKRFEEEITNLTSSQEHTTAEMKDIDDSFPKLDAKIANERESLRSMKFKSAQTEKNSAAERNTKLSLLDKVEQLTHDIRKFEENQGDDPLGALQREIEQLKSGLFSAKQRLNHLSSEIEDLVTKQSNSGTHRRNITDTLRIKRLNSKAVEYTEKLAKARAEIADAKRSSEHQDWEAKINASQSQIDVSDREVSAKTGESKAIGQHLAEIRHESKTTYVDTHEKYQDALSKLETNKGVIGDLEKYVKVMDSAIMRYHSNKMAQINSLLDQMWRQTYTGTDIDTISIRSESDPGSTSGRANYNYRVCMVKRDTESDMRGRCSAGQKVSASIIIRMVLAESFGPTSGLIVLDEPTTNLDAQNISALAQSLNEIIGGRVAQRNFQLIVITHDEHFLSLMNPADFCEDYFLIKRDSKQLSRIERKPIASLGYES